MIHTFADVADFAASLALIFVLALAYGALHRRMPEVISPQFVLGTLFGIIACLEMQRPLQPFDGVLIDMRNVPIALAGAFLGRSGLAACLVIALTSRLYLGGAGAIAGVTGMMVAGGMGYLWHILTIRAERRRLGRIAQKQKIRCLDHASSPCSRAQEYPKTAQRGLILTSKHGQKRKFFRQ